MTSQTRRLLFACIAALAAALLYAHTVHFEFTWDDTMLLQAAGGPGRWTRAFIEPVDRLYRPLRTLMFMAENAARASDPAALSHGVNVALYAAACAAFFWFCTALLGARWAAAAALLFAAHPAHAEVVSSVGNGRADLLAALFVFCSLALVAARPRTAARTGAALLLFALALMSKESAAVLPGIVFVLAFCGYSENSAAAETSSALRRAVLLALPFAAVAGVYAALRFLALDTGAQIHGWHGGSFRATVLTSLGVVPAYAAQLFVPVPQCPIYDVSIVRDLSARAVFGAALVLGSACAGLLCLKRRPIISLCIFWILISWLPVSNLLPVAALRADRFLFLPSAGAALGVVLALRAGAGALAAKQAGAARFAVAAVLAALFTWYAVAARQASLPWRYSEALWSRAVTCAPESPLAWNNHGNALLHARRLSEAEAAYRNALARDPRFPQPFLGLAEACGRQGRYAKAAEHLLKGKKLDPANSAFDCRLASAYSLMQRHEEARAWRRSCIMLSVQRGGANEARR
jgi:hypothetical protein